jgi:hypothetical protein
MADEPQERRPGEVWTERHSSGREITVRINPITGKREELVTEGDGAIGEYFSSYAVRDAKGRVYFDL